MGGAEESAKVRESFVARTTILSLGDGIVLGCYRCWSRIFFPLMINASLRQTGSLHGIKRVSDLRLSYETVQT